MSEKKRENISSSSEDESDPSYERLMQDQSPDDAEDRFLQSIPPPAPFADALPVASSSGACSSSKSSGFKGFLKKLSPFKKTGSPSKEEKPRKKLKKESPLKKVKKAFRRTFQRSEPIRGTAPEYDLSPGDRKFSANSYFKDEEEKKAKKSLFNYFYSSPGEESPERVKTESTKGGIFGASTSKGATASPQIKKKTLSRQASSQHSEGQQSEGNVSVGFFGEALLSDSSGIPTESSSLDIRSGTSFSPPLSRRSTINKRDRDLKESDEYSSSSD